MEWVTSLVGAVVGGIIALASTMLVHYLQRQERMESRREEIQRDVLVGLHRAVLDVSHLATQYTLRGMDATTTTPLPDDESERFRHASVELLRFGVLVEDRELHDHLGELQSSLLRIAIAQDEGASDELLESAARHREHLVLRIRDLLRDV